jgi:hypothetical protein
VTVNTVLYLGQIHAWKSCDLFAVYSSSQCKNFLWSLFNAGEVATGLANKYTRNMMARAEKKTSLASDYFHEIESRTHLWRISTLQIKSVCLSELLGLTAAAIYQSQYEIPQQ